MACFEFPPRIKNDFEGYKILINFYDEIKDLVADEIILDFGKVGWFEANLTAILGAVINNALGNFNNIKIKNLSSKTKEIFEKNHFLGHFGGLNIAGIHNTTIEYKKFKTSEERSFQKYIDEDLLSKKSIPKMSPLLKKEISKSILEIFNNASIHGGCNNIFSCGQFFPKYKKLDFTIVDIGKTIKKNVSEYLDQELSGENAIRWASEKGNTTRRGDIPGGLGFGLIYDFLKKNGGKIQISSADGYLELSNNQETGKNFPYSFPGTIVNLEFNLEDNNYYVLSSEVKDKIIF